MKYAKLFSSVLRELVQAIEEMINNTNHMTGIRPRRFYFDDYTFWPCNNHYERSWFYVKDSIRIYDLYWEWEVGNLAEELILHAGNRPRKILRTLRRIQAAIAWCRARTAYGLELSSQQDDFKNR